MSNVIDFLAKKAEKQKKRISKILDLQAEMLSKKDLLDRIRERSKHITRRGEEDE